MADTCFRLRHGKTFLTSISCEADNSSCCFLNRIFTLTEETITTTLICKESWYKCLTNTAALFKEPTLSDMDKILLIVFGVLIFIVLLIIVFFLYRLIRQRERQKNKKSIGTESSNMIINMESVNPNPKVVEAAQIFVTNAAMRTTTREKEPLDLKDKLAQLIKTRDEEKLAAFLETVGDYYEGKLDADSVENAKGVLEAWRTESELEKFCNAPDQLQPCELVNLQKTVQQAEESPYNLHIHALIVKHAKHRLSSELGRQNMINDLKIRINKAMQENNLEELENLVDIIRHRHLDGEFEKELWYAQNQFDKQCWNGAALVERDLVSAMGRKDAGVLRRAIQRAEQSEYKGELTKQLEDAKKIMVELEEVDKLKNLHKQKITDAIQCGDISRMEQTLHNVKVDGFGEDLNIEIGDLEMALKRKYLQKRLRGNLNVAVQNLDLVRLRRAINEVTASGFLRELGLELDEAHGLLTKLERIELIKKAVMELTNGHIAEIKSYSAPPVQVHKVMMALLIVLGEEPDLVRDWFEIQVILVKTGKLSLKRRVQEYNPLSLSTGNAKRAANIISDIRSDELYSISKAAKVFYLWTSAVVEDRLALDVIQ